MFIYITKRDYCLFAVEFQVIEEFYNIFGPELKAVTGDPHHIEEVLKRVDALVKPIEEVPDSDRILYSFRLVLWFVLLANFNAALPNTLMLAHFSYLVGQLTLSDD